MSALERRGDTPIFLDDRAYSGVVVTVCTILALGAFLIDFRRASDARRAAAPAGG